MGQKFVTYDAKGIVTGCFEVEPTDGAAFIEIDDDAFLTVMQSSFGWQGWTVVTDALTAPAPAPSPTAAEVAAQVIAQQAQVAFLAGITIKSSATPALDATYAVDQLSQMDILSIETSINAGKGFPGGGETFNFPDMSGGMHLFTEANFTNFAAAVRDYVYSLKCCVSGSLTTLPSQTVTIA